MSRLQMEDLFSFTGTAPTSQDIHESNSGSSFSRKLKVTLLSSEWRSTNGGLSTINRELAIHLAKNPSVEVSVYLPQCSEKDKRGAASHNVHLIEAEAMPGDNPVDCLSFLPEGHAVDCVIGHGAVLGRQVQFIKRHHKCKWIQIVHTAPEELAMYKSHAISRAEKLRQDEVKLCEKADQVVAVGPKLADVFRRYLRSCRKDRDVLDLTPGIFCEFADVKQATEERKTFSVLVFGPYDNGDFELNGYDIAACAIAELKDEPQPYQLLFVGAPRGKEEKVKHLLLQQGIERRQLIVRCFSESKEQLAGLFCEVDLAIMPSRSVGFGLATLEALSAGLPVLVSGNSGLGEALKKVPYGFSFVVESEDPRDWAQAIKAVRYKDRKMRLEEIKKTREAYAGKYSWEEQCDKLVERMSNITSRCFHATAREPFVSSTPGEASYLNGDIVTKKRPILASECRRGSDRRPFSAEKPRPEKQVFSSLSKVNSIPNACTFTLSDLFVQVSPLKIFVQVMSQEIITLEVDSSDTIANLKEKIKDKKGFPGEQQRLFFQTKKLKDDRTVSDYNIQNKSTLNLLLQVPAEQMYRLEVTILMEGRKRVTLALNAIDSILELKRKIKDVTGVPRHKQSLSCAGIELENERTISAYNIRNKSFINLVVKITVYLVTPLTQERMTLVQKPKDTIGSVKDKIHAETKILSHQQVLKFNGIELDDVHTLKYYNIESKSTLFLYVSMEIFVEMSNGTVVNLKLFKSNTIKDVKERIYLREDIPCDMQRLYFLGQLLRHRHTLSDLNIQNKSILHCIVMITIHIKMPNEDEISVDVNLDDNVRSVRDRIQAKGGIPPDQLCLLMYKGEKLNNRYTLKHYKIRNGSILSLVKSGVGNLDLRMVGKARRPQSASSTQPSTQEVFNRIADKCFEKVDPSNPKELKGFLKYLKEVREVLVLDVKTGSLIFTLECRSLKILDDLWEDYSSGHLNKVAQFHLVTNDILKEFGLSSFKLASNIKKEEYRTCRQRLTMNANQTLDRHGKQLREAFLRWITIRRHTKEKLEHLEIMLGKPRITTGTLVGAALGGILAAPFTFGTSLMVAAAGVGIGAAIGAGTSYLSAEEEKTFRLADVQGAIDEDREACIRLQGQLDFFNRTFTSTTSEGAIPGIMVRNLSEARSRISQFADSSVLPRDITQIVKSSLDHNQGSTSAIVGEIRSILNDLKCPDETEIQRLV